jgi:hypothetical protein
VARPELFHRACSRGDRGSLQADVRPRGDLYQSRERAERRKHSQPTLSDLTMADTKTNAEKKASVRYLRELRIFTNLVDAAEHVKPTRESYDFVVDFKQGSTWDIVFKTWAPRGSTRAAVTDTLYFVHQEHEIIFAARTDIAPNFSRFYGKLSVAPLINWAAIPAPRVLDGRELDADLIQVRSYGGAPLYLPRSSALQEVVARLKGG